jgi:pimeloyl-ACP methyl ester carboxylesterase
VLGESWGSLIGVRLVAKHPDWFSAYIGIGQNIRGADMLSAAYDFCLKSAEQENNAKALKVLHKTTVPKPEMSNRTLYKSMQITGTWMDYYLLTKYHYNNDAGIFFRSLWEAPEYSFFDFKSTLTGYISTGKKVIRDACFYDLKQNITKLELPVYMIMGEYDFWTPLAKSYFDTLQAPLKEWYVIKGAGHMVRGDKPDEVENILINKVLTEAIKE